MRYRFLSLAALALASTVAISPMTQARNNLFGGVPLDATIMRAGSTAQKIARLKFLADAKRAAASASAATLSASATWQQSAGGGPGAVASGIDTAHLESC